MEDQPVVETVAGELDEVLDGLRRVVGEQLEANRAVIGLEPRVHRMVSASGSIAAAVGSSSPASSLRAISRASRVASPS